MATTRQPRQFLAVWNDAGTEVKGATFEESVYVEGAFWKNELTSVAPENFGEFGTMFSNQLQIQHDVLVVEKATLLVEKATLESEKASLTSQLASKTTEADSLAADKLALQSEVTQLNSSISELTSESNALASSVSDLTEKLDASTYGNDTLSAELAAARARITSLLEEIPFDPRVIDATAFYDRLTKDEIWSLSTSEDEITKSILAKIHEYKKPENDWPIVFESTEFMQMMGYLLQSGFITEARMMDLTRDATKAEAYKADKA